MQGRHYILASYSEYEIKITPIIDTLIDFVNCKLDFTLILSMVILLKMRGIDPKPF